MDTKKCTSCKKELPLNSEYFADRNYKGENVYQAMCRECHKEYRKIHYESNKDKYIKKAIKYKKDFIDLFNKYKKSLFCQNCKDDRYWVLDFHHINPLEKDFEIATLIQKGSKKLLDKEINKCIVLCANCHRDLHYKEKQANNA